MQSGAGNSVGAGLCLLIAAAIFGLGCGSSDDAPAADDERQITALLGQLREVQESGDAERACAEVYVVREMP